MTPQLTLQQALDNLKTVARLANKGGLIDIEAVPSVLESLAILQSLISQEPKQLTEAE